MTDAELIARLIYYALIAPAPTDEDIAHFRELMDLYARAAARDAAQLREAETLEQIVSMMQPDATERREDPAPPPPEADANRTGQDGTGRDGAGTIEGEDGAAAVFSGKGAAEKKRIHARLLAFCAARPGVSGKLARATNGVLETTQIYDMRNSGRFTMAQWRTVDAAMDRIEQIEKGASE